MAFFDRFIGPRDATARAVRRLKNSSNVDRLKSACATETDLCLKLLAFSRWSACEPTDDAGLSQRWRTCGAAGGSLDCKMEHVRFEPLSYYRTIDAIDAQTLRLAAAATDNPYFVDHLLATAPADPELFAIVARKAESDWIAWAKQRRPEIGGRVKDPESDGIPAVPLQPVPHPDHVPDYVLRGIRPLLEDLSNPLRVESRPILNLSGYGTPNALIIDDIRGSPVALADREWADRKTKAEPELATTLGPIHHFVGRLSEPWPECESSMRSFVERGEYHTSYDEERHRFTENLLIECLRLDNPVVRCNAAKLLRKMAREGTIYLTPSAPLEDAAEDPNPAVRAAALETLGHIALTRGVSAVEDRLRAALQDRLRIIRYNATQCLLAALVNGDCELYSEQILAALRGSLADWCAGPSAALTLAHLGWQPGTEAEVVHHLGSQRDRDGLEARWDSVKQVLFKDMRTREARQVENALFLLIGIGRSEVIADLIKTLNRDGDKIMAECYLNCGQSELEVAARSWAAERGYEIEQSDRVKVVAWGALLSG